MISTVFLSGSLSWLVGEFLISVVAMLGGMMVFRGLWIEKKADKEVFLNVDEFRTAKLKAKRGWNLLMWGIAIETAVAGVFAAKDGWEIRRIKINEAKNDPLNQPILDVSATVQFRVDKSDFSELPPFGNPIRAADLWLIAPPTPSVITANGGRFPGGDRMWNLVAGTEFPILSTAHLIGFPAQKGGRSYFMQFHFDEAWAEFEQQRMEKQVNEINHVNVLRISIKCLPHNLKILDGSVKLVINDTVQKMFQIPQQEDNRYDVGFPDTYSNTTPFVILAYLTNSPTH